MRKEIQSLADRLVKLKDPAEVKRLRIEMLDKMSHVIDLF